jgi:hypothetical protein
MPVLKARVGGTWVDVSGGVPTSAPRGIVARRTATASVWTNATTTPTDITVTTGLGPIATVVLDTTRLYLFTFRSHIRSTTTGDRIGFELWLNGAMVQQALLSPHPTASTAFQGFAQFIVQPTVNGSQDTRIKGKSGAGTSTVSVHPSTDIPMVYLIEDVGLAA